MNDVKIADIHIHALYNSDDGAKSKEEMLGIVKVAYESGARLICFTPHYHPAYYGENKARSENSFNEICDFAKEKYPDVRLYLGNELFYEKGARVWIEKGECRTLGGTNYILVDFSDGESEKFITDALHRLLNAGFSPVLAHVERYRSLHGKFAIVDSYKNDGILIQSDAGSFFGENGHFSKRFLLKLISFGLCDIIASDAHGTNSRKWELRRAYDFVSDKFGAAEAARMFYDTPSSLFE